MSKIVPLNTHSHRHIRVAKVRRYPEVEKEQLIPLTVFEIALVALDAPIVFVEDINTGGFRLAMLCGIKANENLFAQGAQWSALYTPAAIRNNPMTLSSSVHSPEQMFLCIDEESDQIVADGIPLFDEDGSESDFLKATSEDLSRIQSQHEATEGFVSFLAENGLLRSKELNLKTETEGGILVNGLFVVDEAKLNALNDETTKDLRERGYLSMVYAHLLSLQQVLRLARMHDSV